MRNLLKITARASVVLAIFFFNGCSKSDSALSEEQDAVVNYNDDEAKAIECLRQKCGSSQFAPISIDRGCGDDPLCDHILWERVGTCEFFNTATHVYFYIKLDPASGYRISFARVNAAPDPVLLSGSSVGKSSSGCYTTSMLFSFPISSFSAGNVFFESYVSLVKVQKVGNRCTVLSSDYALNEPIPVYPTVPWDLFLLQPCTSTN
ncbi:hypothetical protein C3K47_18460 [Solitalea longa]|uniref:Uncharacterized protein n=1 Tax=Solitalea longa TaxID=2079460 RepID=A0A2S4ZY11_9SPHI|nr:hypothetical protein [Solitalea longa]POY34822.1 hypothetical protein C3K47_18460 [Solitalea longa]